MLLIRMVTFQIFQIQLSMNQSKFEIYSTNFFDKVFPNEGWSSGLVTGLQCERFWVQTLEIPKHFFYFSQEIAQKFLFSIKIMLKSQINSKKRPKNREKYKRNYLKNCMFPLYLWSKKTLQISYSNSHSNIHNDYSSVL